MSFLKFSEQTLALWFSLIRKMIEFKQGALIIPSVILSFFSTHYIDSLFLDVPTKQLVLPLMVLIFGSAFYFAFNLIDLGLGIKAAKTKRETINPLRLYVTLWKFLGVLILNGFLTFVTIVAATIAHGIPYHIPLWILLIAIIMECGFEFHSIGKNIEKINGEKPAFFEFYDNILNLTKIKIFTKIKGKDNFKNEN